MNPTLPTRSLTTAQMDAVALPPISVPQGANVADITSSLLAHLERSLAETAAPPKLQPVQIQAMSCRTILASSAAEIKQAKEFYSIGFEGNGSYARVVGALRIAVMPTLLTCRLESKETYVFRVGALLSRLSGCGVLFPGILLLPVVLWGFLGPLGAVIGVVFILLVLLSGLILAPNKKKQVAELTQLVSFALLQAYESYDPRRAKHKVAEQNGAAHRDQPESVEQSDSAEESDSNWSGRVRD